jgi:hypothetical protein
MIKSTSAEIMYTLKSTTSQGGRRTSAVKLSTPPFRGVYLTSVLHGTRYTVHGIPEAVLFFGV